MLSPKQPNVSLGATTTMEFEEGESQQPPSRVRHINKRALKNKALAVSFNEKDLKDYVTGFHKRKKKRRKVAQKQQEEVLRRKRIENRKKRKLERLLICGGAPTESEENDENQEDDEESEPIASANGTMEYDTGDMKVIVRTSEISAEDKAEQSAKTETVVPRLTTGDDKKKQQSLGVSKKKVFKQVSRHRSSKCVSKADKRKGKNKNNKKR